MPYKPKTQNDAMLRLNKQLTGSSVIPVNGHPLLVTIPADETVSVDSDEPSPNGQVTVDWSGKLVHVFESDLKRYTKSLGS